MNIVIEKLNKNILFLENCIKEEERKLNKLHTDIDK